MTRTRKFDLKLKLRPRQRTTAMHNWDLNLLATKLFIWLSYLNSVSLPRNGGMEGNWKHKPQSLNQKEYWYLTWKLISSPRYTNTTKCRKWMLTMWEVLLAWRACLIELLGIDLHWRPSRYSNRLVYWLYLDLLLFYKRCVYTRIEEQRNSKTKRSCWSTA